MVSDGFSWFLVVFVGFRMVLLWFRVVYISFRWMPLILWTNPTLSLRAARPLTISILKFKIAMQSSASYNKPMRPPIVARVASSPLQRLRNECFLPGLHLLPTAFCVVHVVSAWFPLVLSGFRVVFRGFLVVFRGFRVGFRVVFRGFPWFPRWFPRGFPRFPVVSADCIVVSAWFSVVSRGFRALRGGFRVAFRGFRWSPQIARWFPRGSPCFLVASGDSVWVSAVFPLCCYRFCHVTKPLASLFARLQRNLHGFSLPSRPTASSQLPSPQILSLSPWILATPNKFCAANGPPLWSEPNKAQISRRQRSTETTQNQRKKKKTKPS